MKLKNPLDSKNDKFGTFEECSNCNRPRNRLKRCPHCKDPAEKPEDNFSFSLSSMFRKKKNEKEK